MIIKILLLASLAGAAYLLMHGRPTALSLLVRRGLAIGVLCMGAFAVLFPDAVTAVGNSVGVGRGSDLVLYLLCVTFLFTTIGLHLRLATMHDRFVELSRRVAISEARGSLTARPEQAQNTPPGKV